MAKTESDDDSDNRWLKTILWFAAAGAVYLVHAVYDNFSVDGLVRHASELAKAGRCYEAIEKLDWAIRRDPTVAAAHLERGICHYRAGRYDEALADFDDTLRYRPDSFAGYFDRGLVQLAKGQDDAALADFERAIKLKPDDPGAHFQRATILRDRERTDEAIAEYDTAIRLKPDEARYRLDRADTFRDKGDFAAAIAAYDETIRAVPDESAAAYFARAVTRRYQGDTDGALNEINAAIGRWPQLASGYIERGTILLFDQEKPAEAAEDIAKAFDMGVQYKLTMVLVDTAGDQFGIARTDYKYRLAPHTPFVPNVFYWTIRLHVARAHAGQDDKDELAKNARRVAVDLSPGLLVKTELPYWPNEIVRLFQGLSTPDNVRAAAKSTMGGTDISIHRRACDADFYLAEYQLEKGARDAARALFESAAANCPPSAPERGFARAEIKRLSKDASLAR